MVQEGEEAAESLGELRYGKCVTEGMTYTAWAEKVGVSLQAVRQSVLRYAESHGLPTEVVNPVQNPQGGRPRGSGTSTPRPEPADRESLTEQRWALAIDGLRLQAENFAAVAERMREMAPPSPDVKERLVGALDEAITNMQALRRHLRRN